MHIKEVDTCYVLESRETPGKGELERESEEAM